VAYADFTAEEVGRPMSEEEKVHVHVYGRIFYQFIIILLIKKSQSGICLVRM